MENEEVLVFPARILDDYKFTNFQAYTPAYRNLVTEIRSASAFMPRAEVENDPTVLQVIPYSYVYGFRPEVLVYRRTKKGNESRLHGKFSIGVGGHINPIDNKGDQIFKIAALRELNEEFLFAGENLRPSDIMDFTLRGFIRRTDTPVNSVHFGLVYSFASPSHVVIPVAHECEVIGWFGAEDLRKPEMLDNLEDWSKDLLTALRG
jgi:predicted NUDIX family phosphoesterase